MAKYAETVIAPNHNPYLKSRNREAVDAEAAMVPPAVATGDGIEQMDHCIDKKDRLDFALADGGFVIV